MEEFTRSCRLSNADAGIYILPCEQVEDFGMKLAHQFPWTAAAAVAVGLALRRRFLSDPDSPSTVTRRLQVTKVSILLRP